MYLLPGSSKRQIGRTGDTQSPDAGSTPAPDTTNKGIAPKLGNVPTFTSYEKMTPS